MSRPVRIYCLLAGSGDFLTGLLLVAAPLFTLRLMGIASIPAEPVYLRFVGAFVGGVGALYLYPFALSAARRAQRLDTVLEATALVRIVVALVVGGCIASGTLEVRWITVALTDAVLAAVQIGILSRQARRISPPDASNEHDCDRPNPQ